MTAAALNSDQATIDRLLRASLDPSVLEVIDESADHIGHAGSNGLGKGTHFRVRIASPRFQTLSRVAQHRLVYDAVQPLMAVGLHALAIEILPTH